MATIIGYNSDEDKTFVIHYPNPVTPNEAWELLFKQNLIETGDLGEDQRDVPHRDLNRIYAIEGLYLVAIIDETVNPTFVPQQTGR